jgi:hypothetical protein
MLSNLSDAPMLGEAAILWQLSVQPQAGFPLKAGGQIPVYVYVVLLTALLVGLFVVLESVWTFQQVGRESAPEVRALKLQVAVWFFLLGVSAVAILMGRGLIGMVALIAALRLPIRKRKKPPKGAQDWPQVDGKPVPPSSQ